MWRVSHWRSLNGAINRGRPPGRRKRGGVGERMSSALGSWGWDNCSVFEWECPVGFGPHGPGILWRERLKSSWHREDGWNRRARTSLGAGRALGRGAKKLVFQKPGEEQLLERRQWLTTMKGYKEVNYDKEGIFTPGFLALAYWWP